jgi:L-seryl-tRNA(Ser) seleniumtransferase
METGTTPSSGKSDRQKGILPSVDFLLNTPELLELQKVKPRYFVTKAVRETLDILRKEILEESGRGGEKGSFNPGNEEILERIRKRTLQLTSRGMKRCVNGTGIILHTGMGRAVLPGTAVRALAMMGGFVNVQADLETGKRSQRDHYVERLLCELTGAEAATVVNNNAAATMIALNTLGEGRDALVSRGQLIEIGGSFRLPEVMEKSGVIMRELGTTNRTHLRDYENAITPNTALIFRAHPSNYKISGFTTMPDIKELVNLGRKHGIPVVDDLGAGAFIDFAPFGFSDEPMVQKSIKAGADLVLFSGDKLLGGPQAGIILGKKDLVKRVRKNPLSRVLRVCKLTLCALEETLFLYFDRDSLMRENPMFRLLARTLETLTASAESLVERLRSVAPSFTFTIADDISYMGSGSLPMEDIKTKAVAVTSRHMNCDALSAKLRMADTPIFARIKEDMVLIDVRTLLEGEDEVVVRAFGSLEHGLEHAAKM